MTAEQRFSQRARRLLDATPLLAQANTTLVQQLGVRARRRLLPLRQQCIDGEEMRQRIFFVVSGSFHLLRQTPDGEEVLVSRYGPGDFFCLAAAFSGSGPVGYAVNTSPAQLLCWSLRDFQALMQTDSSLGERLLRQMAWQVEQERQMRTLLCCCRAENRVAAYLLYRRQACRPQPDDAQLDLKPLSLTAAELGLARETLSRCLHRLQRQQIIQCQRGQVRILRELGLRLLVGTGAEADQKVPDSCQKMPDS